MFEAGIVKPIVAISIEITSGGAMASVNEDESRWFYELAMG